MASTSDRRHGDEPVRHRLLDAGTPSVRGSIADPGRHSRAVRSAPVGLGGGAWPTAGPDRFEPARWTI